MKPESSHSFVESAGISWKNAGEGMKRKILSYDSQIMMVHVEFIKGAVGTIHTHPHRQITFVESGKFEVRVGDQKRVLSKGDSFIVAPDVPHGVIALEAGELVDVFTPARYDFL
ncbi:MAG TPA: cupin domain-containing protein [Candidatus Kryptonia bacterium]